MKKKNNHHAKSMNALLAAFAVICVSFAPAILADDCHESAIVGLWRVDYYAGTTRLFTTYDQWHSDGLEFEVNSIAPGAVCQGTFKEMGNGRVKLFHVIWTFDSNGVVNGHIEETQINLVNHQRTNYQGTWDNKVYDLNNNLVGESTGTLSATRLTVH